jgi:hypothetical protein
MGENKISLKEQIALKFAADYAYPLDDQTKLERVAKYVAATDDIMAPKEAFAEYYGNLTTPNFSGLPNEPHRVLADLPSRSISQVISMIGCIVR